MSIPALGGGRRYRQRSQFVELLKVQGKLAMREPYGFIGGLGLPVALLVVFGWIGQQNPGTVSGTRQTIIDLWTPTVLVLSFVFISLSLPRTMVRDREIGWLRRISTTPIRPSRLLSAELAFDLVLAVAAVIVIIPGGALVFGASIHVEVLPFAVSLVLAIAELFALGLMLVALMPSQTVSQVVTGAVALPLMFLSGLWVNPAQTGEPLRTIMYYSPTGAAAKALLDSVFNGSSYYPALVTMALYAAGFGFVAVRYFRWE